MPSRRMLTIALRSMSCSAAPGVKVGDHALEYHGIDQCAAPGALSDLRGTGLAVRKIDLTIEVSSRAVRSEASSTRLSEWEICLRCGGESAATSPWYRQPALGVAGGIMPVMSMLRVQLLGSAHRDNEIKQVGCPSMRASPDQLVGLELVAEI